MNCGFKYPGPHGGQLLEEFEYQLLRLQLLLEDTCVQLATARDRLARNRPVVVMLDRGVLDMKAYMPPEVWAAITRRCGVTEQQLVARYDLVVHLVTAADGAEQFYSSATNAARQESPELARELDQKVATTWSVHPRRVVVTNQGVTFTEKVARATSVVVNFVSASDNAVVGHSPTAHVGPHTPLSGGSASPAGSNDGQGPDTTAFTGVTS
jgi:hypothetical protein